MNCIRKYSMISEIPASKIPGISNMKKMPAKLWKTGRLDLLDRPMVSIVGSRRPSLYSQTKTKELAFMLAQRGVAVVSGAAMGIDAMAHIGAGAANTIAVTATGLDIRYPAVNKALIKDIEKNGLLLSLFAPGSKPGNWNFVIRNELVVALGEILVIAEADLESGSMRSAEYALKMGKKIFVFPHRLGESKGTNHLLKEGLADPIYDFEKFVSRYGEAADESIPKDEFFYFCQQNPTVDEAVERFGERVYEAELEGVIVIESGRISLR